MNHQTYINQAVELALNNVKNGGKPFGAVIVKNDTVIATGINKAVQTGDLTPKLRLSERRAGRGKTISSMGLLFMPVDIHAPCVCRLAIWRVSRKCTISVRSKKPKKPGSG